MRSVLSLAWLAEDPWPVCGGVYEGMQGFDMWIMIRHCDQRPSCHAQFWEPEALNRNQSCVNHLGLNHCLQTKAGLLGDGKQAFNPNNSRNFRP